MERVSGGFKLPIVAPTLGLTTRPSPDEPDLRAATIASNVRFEKGVVKNAHGFKTITTAFELDSAPNLIYQTQFYQPATNVGIVGTSRYLYIASAPISPNTLNMFQLYDYGSKVADIRNRIVAASFFNRVLFAQPDSPLISWNGVSSVAGLAIGLDPNDRWQGVNVFREYVVIWNQSTFKWCATDNVDQWIPVGATATSALLNVTQAFNMPPADGLTSTGWIYVDSSTASLLAIGQYMYLQIGSQISYLQVTGVIPSTGSSGQVAGFSQSVAVGATQDVFINTYLPYVAGAQLQFQNSLGVLTVNSAAVNPGTLVSTVAAAFSVPNVGSSVVVKTAAAPDYTPGTYVSVGISPNPGTDVYLVDEVDLINFTLTLTKMGVGFTNATMHQAGEFIVPQPSVNVTNNSTNVASGSFITPLLELYGFEGTVVNLTGAIASGTAVPIGTQIFSVDANGAGEVDNAGVQVNGPILWFDTLGDYGYIFKNRSIQIVQFVGLDQGTFYIRPIVTDEGFLGAYSFAKVGLDTMYFMGNKEIYKYTGFKQLTPIARQHSVQVYEELDKTRADAIVGYHNEKNFEIWFAYPTTSLAAGLSPYRVLIYNYVEDSCTIDDYDPSVHPGLILNGISALGRLDLSQKITWADATGTWVTPTSWPANATWQSLLSDAPISYTLGGFQLNETVGWPTLVLMDTNFDRDGVAMLCQYESADFSCGDPSVWKYHDTLEVSFYVLPLVPQNNPFVVLVQIGSRNNLDDDIVWSNFTYLPVQGNRKNVMQANLKRSGRYLRIRINSNQAGCGWRISRFTPMGRLGGPY